MKFLVDMPLSPSLVDWLRERSHEASHLVSRGMGKSSDEDILRLARQEGTTVITADLDFPRLIALGGDRTPALILFRGGNYSADEMQSLLRRVLEVVPPDQMEESIIVVDKFRIRRIHLPISR